MTAQSNGEKGPINDDRGFQTKDVKTLIRIGLNNREADIVKTFESKDMITLLLFIDERSPVIWSEIRESLDCGHLFERLEDLESLGLITSFKTVYPETNYSRITLKGREVADGFRFISRLIDMEREKALNPP